MEEVELEKVGKSVDKYGQVRKSRETRTTSRQEGLRKFGNLEKVREG